MWLDQADCGIFLRQNQVTVLRFETPRERRLQKIPPGQPEGILNC